MPLSREKLLASLRQLHQERRHLVRRLTRDDELAVGTVSVVRRKCGNPQCHCASGDGHLQTLFLFKDKQGTRRCKLVRRADEARLQQAGERYREFREDLKRLRVLDRREKQIFAQLKESRSVRYG